MSHELRTPLNSIIGFTGIMLQGLAGPLNAEQTKQMGMVQSSARHLLALINDVLDISKIEAGQLEIHAEPFDLRASLEKVAALVKPLADKKGLALRVVLPPDVEPAVNDRLRVEQVLLNLLNNAIKFTERGARHARGGNRAWHTSPLRTPQSAFPVTDTGIGIKPEDMEKIFQPFRQIDSGLTRQHDGTGLGLTICRHLANLMGGEISAKSLWGEGSVFTFVLPLKHKSNAMKPKILLIEDNEQNRYLATFLLEKHGYAVVPASDGPTGIALGQSHEPRAYPARHPIANDGRLRCGPRVAETSGAPKHPHHRRHVLRDGGRP